MGSKLERGGELFMGVSFCLFFLWGVLIYEIDMWERVFVLVIYVVFDKLKKYLNIKLFWGFYIYVMVFRFSLVIL